jgi:hypothetical protein
VPREAYVLGMAGVLPYLGTSLSTIYCAWEINNAHTTGSAMFLNERTAEAALHVLEPLQVGYGAVVSVTIHRVTQYSSDPVRRSSLSSAPFTGVWSSLAMAAATDTSAMQSVSGPPQSPGPPPFSRLNTP